MLLHISRPHHPNNYQLPRARDFVWVTFDPRGTNPNAILANCFNETESATTAACMLAPLNNIIAAVTAAWNSNRKLWETCKEKLGENGTLIGSVYTARDLLAIVDALGEDRMLGYYGKSACQAAHEHPLIMNREFLRHSHWPAICQIVSGSSGTYGD